MQMMTGAQRSLKQAQVSPVVEHVCNVCFFGMRDTSSKFSWVAVEKMRAVWVWFSRPTVLTFITYPRLTCPNFCLDRDGLTPAGGGGGKIDGPGIFPPVRGQLSLKDFLWRVGRSWELKSSFCLYLHDYLESRPSWTELICLFAKCNIYQLKEKGESCVLWLVIRFGTWQASICASVPFLSLSSFGL